tara:strand:+ start:1139 stop:1816 length:678 start_codon:yes stop_codon:yes gene_type:complete
MEGYRAPEQAAGADSAARTRHESWIHRPWVPWAAGAVAFTLTILTGTVVFADAVWRNVEMQNFLERVEASEQAMQDLQDSTAAAFEDHGGEGQQQKLDAELRSLAADAEQGIAAAGADVSDLPIAIWHTDIERARQAYLDHNNAWQEYMARASESASEFLAPQQLVNQTFFDAEEPFYRAVPVPDLFGLNDQVALIFTDGQEQESSGQLVARLERGSHPTGCDSD